MQLNSMPSPRLYQHQGGDGPALMRPYLQPNAAHHLGNIPIHQVAPTSHRMQVQNFPQAGNAQYPQPILNANQQTSNFVRANHLF